MNISLNTTYELLRDKLIVWYQAGVNTVPNLIVAIIILIFFLVLAKAARSITGQVMMRISQNRPINELLSTIVVWMIMAIGIFIALGVLKLDKTVASLLAGAGVLGLALGFAFQEITANFVSGVIIAMGKTYEIGDILEVSSIHGKVIRIDIRYTILKTFDGLDAIIPNKDMLTKEIINYTKDAGRRITLPVGVSYGEDLEKVEAVLKKALDQIPGTLKGKPLEILFNEFGDSSINLLVRYWMESPDQSSYQHSLHYVVKAIKKAFDANNIVIPFPIRTLDFGIKGGMQLGEVKQTHQRLAPPEAT